MLLCIFAYGDSQYLGYEKIEKLGVVEYFCIQNTVYMKTPTSDSTYILQPFYGSSPVIGGIGNYKPFLHTCDEFQQFHSKKITKR